jgi:hypothetical protein
MVTDTDTHTHNDADIHTHLHTGDDPYRHGHAHPHPPGAAEVLPDPSRVATVTLDIGEGFGALVIHTPAGLSGQEIEIRPDGTEWRGQHTAVRPRILPSGTQFAGVFGSLAEGRYDLRLRGEVGERPTLSLIVDGGSVTDALWPVACA